MGKKASMLRQVSDMYRKRQYYPTGSVSHVRIVTVDWEQNERSSVEFDHINVSLRAVVERHGLDMTRRGDQRGDM